jgi:DNA-binding GntR family transcriptional regulator
MRATRPDLPQLAKPRADDSRATLADAVYETLLEAILSGRLASGAILSEVAVAQQLDVSRTPVHDALRQLAKDGLVEQAVGRRARVAPFTRDDLFEMFEMRKFLEGPAAELAAGRMDQRQLAPLRQAADQLAATSGSVDWVARWADFDEDFHRTIAEASGNRRLADDIARYRLLHRGINRIGTEAEGLQEALAEHLEILAALEARAAAAARNAMVRHIEHWQQYFVQRFPR